MECPDCKGKGGKCYHTHSSLNPVNPHEYRECPTCEGTGEVEDLICPNCNGSGEGGYDGTSCTLCGGTGVHNGC